MSHMHAHTTRWSLIPLLLGTLLSHAPAEIRYTLQDFGVVERLGALNSTGVAVGTLRHPEYEAVRLQAGMAPLPLGFPPLRETSQGSGIGDDGAIVGWAGRIGERGEQAFLWTEAQGMQSLGYGDHQPAFSQALALNTVHAIVGFEAIPPSLAEIRPVVWVGGQPSYLATLGGRAATPHAINEQGDIVGDANPAGSDLSHAVLWPLEGGLVDLQTRPATWSVANALTADRRVVGTVCLMTGCQAFLWTAATGMQPLPLLAGDVASTATGINTHGRIVGWGQMQDFRSHALLWEQGTPLDLQALVDAPGWVLSSATGINDQGQIAGTGAMGDVFHAYLLTPLAPPVPPPPVELVVEVHGDFNGDGWPDKAGLAADTSIWRCLAGEAACTQLDGNAVDLVAGDFTGDGRDDLVAVGSDTSLWVMTDGVQWRQLPGYLRSVIAGHFFGDGRAHLAGIDWVTNLWISPALGQWQPVPGNLKSMIAGRFSGGTRDELAGVDWATGIWFRDQSGTWRSLPGNLLTIHARHGQPGQPDGMRGMAADGTLWESSRLGEWHQVGQGQVMVQQ